MTNGGNHNRHSHSFDKRVPLMKSVSSEITAAGYKYKTGFGSIARQIIKRMHKKKIRQHNQKLSRENGE